MPFSEKTKRIAKQKSAFRCCLCHNPFVEIHHIIPQEEGGPDALDNAAPLCSSCHDLYGGNPDKRKTIRQMRDAWWELMEKREANILATTELDDTIRIKADRNYKGSLKSNYAAIFHTVFADEDFETAASHIFDLVKQAQALQPNQKRILLLVIEGHRTETGAFDDDMFILQTDFLIGYMMRYLTEIVMPLNHVRNTRIQQNDLQNELIFSGELTTEKLSELVDKYDRGEFWLGEKKKLIRFGGI